ncbi:MAG: hypothetical protein JSV84_14965 [Gemmatimonadota bacterium]|nr:MAG: hypothetical protein JSV84_14965 [Gemmatimonadota bacterium]
MKRCTASLIGFVFIALALASVFSAQEYVSLVKRALDDSSFHWRSFEAEDVRLFYKPDSFAERHRVMLVRSAKASVEEVLKFLGEPGYDRILHVFYVDTRKEMDRIIGRPVAGYADWTGSGVFLVLNPEWRSFDTHEITHVLSMSLWGTPDPTSRWMVEGVAVSCDGWCQEYSVDEIASYLLSQDQLPPLHELFRNFAELGEIRAGFYAASVIGFVRNRYGPDALRDLWMNGSGDLSGSLGSTIDEIEASWKKYLKETAGNEIQIDLENIEELECG